MILCIVIVLLFSVPEGSFQSISVGTSLPTTQSTLKRTTETQNVSSDTTRPVTNGSMDTSTIDSSSAGSRTEHSTVRSTPDQSTSQLSTYKTGSEHTSPSQTTTPHHTIETPQQFNNTTIKQTTSNQSTSQSTWQPQKSTVLKTDEATIKTTIPTGQNNTISSTAMENKGGQDLAGNPGLIAVLCIFFITLAVLLVIVIVKVVRNRRPKFERLDDVPMGNISEDAPFARYPPK